MTHVFVSLALCAGKNKARGERIDSGEGPLLSHRRSLYSPVARILCPPPLPDALRHWRVSDGGSVGPLKVWLPSLCESRKNDAGGVKLTLFPCRQEPRRPVIMEFGEESSPALAFEKEAFELTVEDVYDISYVIGRDLLKISNTGEEVSDLQFRIVRVLEMFETLVNKYNLSLEELKMERDNLKSELDRILKESSSGQGTVSNVHVTRSFHPSLNTCHCHTRVDVWR